MKKHRLILLALMVVLSGIIATSCKKDTNDDPQPSGSESNFTDLNVPDGFTWSTSRFLEIDLAFVNESDEPVPSSFEIYSEYPGGAKYMSGNAAEDGIFYRKYKISGHRESFFVVLPNQDPVEVPFEQAFITIGDNDEFEAYQAKKTITVENPQLKSVSEETYQYFPAEGLFGTIGFEDTWPWQADYDFNDVLLDYNVKATIDDDGLVTKIDMILYLRASGAGYKNGFGISFKHSWCYENEPLADIASVTVNGVPVAPEDTEYPSYILIEDISEYQPTYNTFMDQPFVYPTRFEVEIVMNTPAWDWWEVELPLNNPFIIVNQDRGREVHLPWYLPTSLADPDYVGTGVDASDPEAFNPDNFKSGNMVIGYFTYMTENEYPWGINVYFDDENGGLFQYPVEFCDISNAYYPAFSNWVENWDPWEWYLPEYTVADSVYTKMPSPPYPESE